MPQGDVKISVYKNPCVRKIKRRQKTFAFMKAQKLLKGHDVQLFRM